MPPLTSDDPFVALFDAVTVACGVVGDELQALKALVRDCRADGGDRWAACEEYYALEAARIRNEANVEKEEVILS